MALKNIDLPICSPFFGGSLCLFWNFCVPVHRDNPSLAQIRQAMERYYYSTHDLTLKTLTFYILLL